MNSIIKKALIKSLLISAACFILSIIIYAVMSIVFGTMIDPLSVLILVLMFLAIACFNFIRSFIERSEWGKSKSMNFKNIIFAPVYLGIAIGAALLMGVPVTLPFLLLLAGVFFAVFFAMNVIVYLVAKSKTDEMNNALNSFKKEHWGNEEE